MKIVYETFFRLESATSTEEVDDIPSALGIPDRFKFSESKYPKITFSISDNDIHDLILKGILTESLDIGNLANESPITKLLYAVLWKNGDIPKIRHVVKGILNKREEADNGIVFFQFGKHLSTNSQEPIVDQHVLRAYGIYHAGDDSKEIQRLKHLTLFGKKELPIVEAYKKWLISSLKEGLKRNPVHCYHIDKVLFAVGKYIKAGGT